MARIVGNYLRREIVMPELFPVATCCLLLPYVWECRVRVPCDCLKFFKHFQVELEKLNAATDEINKLELQLDVSFFLIPTHLKVVLFMYLCG